MKILRLVSSRQNCEFNEFLNEDLIIKKNSKMCMANASFILNYPSLTIDGSNNVIQFNCGSGLRTCTLESKTYYGTESGGLILLQDIENALNSQLRLLGKEFGGEYTVSKKSGQIDISYQIEKLSNFLENDFNIPANITKTGDDGDPYIEIQRNSPNATTDDSSRIILENYISRGSGTFRIKLGELTNNNSLINGLSLILSESAWVDLKNAGETLNNELKPFGVHIVADTTTTFKYMYSDGDGTLKDPATVVRILNQGLDGDGNPNINNDILEINIQLGNIQGVVYQNNGVDSVTTTLFSVPLNPQQQYVPCVIMRGGENNLSIFNPQYTDQVSSLKRDYFDTNRNSNLSVPLPPTNRLSTHSIDFSQCTNLAEFLGFPLNPITNNYKYSRPNYRSTANYLGGKNFTASNNDSFICLFDNAMIDSYDTYKKGRSNILKVFPNPSTTVDNRQCQYESNTLDFIDLRNKEDITLRNIKARILNSDYSDISTLDMSILTLYIKDENEK